MKLRLTNARTFVDAPGGEITWLWEYLSFEDGKLSYLKWKGHVKDNRVRMFDRVSRSFPGGFTSMVVKAATAAGVALEVVDQRAPPATPDPAVDLSWLRDYQAEGVRRSISEVRGILWLPTGAGKTEIACGIASALNCSWLFLVHRSQLMEQTAERYEKRTGQPAGRVGDGVWTEERFTVATFQTLSSALKRGSPEAMALLTNARGLIIDEVHVLPAESFTRVAARTPGAYWRIGMSGTPLARGDRRSVIAIGTTGPVIYRIKADLLIKRGLLSKPCIRMVPVHSSSEATTFQGVYGEAVVRNAVRNRTLAEIAKLATKPALMFVREIKHGRLLLDRLSKAGVTAEFVWGSASVERREAAIRRLVHGDCDVLICSVVLQDGIDIPELRSIINAAAGKSVIAAIQKVGRGMRIAEGKGNVVEVWDVQDTGNKAISRHSRQRQRAYEREGYEVVLIAQLEAGKSSAA